MKPSLLFDTLILTMGNTNFKRVTQTSNAFEIHCPTDDFSFLNHVQGVWVFYMNKLNHNFERQALNSKPLEPTFIMIIWFLSALRSPFTDAKHSVNKS